MRRAFSAFLAGVCLVNTVAAAPNLNPPVVAAAENPVGLLRRMASVNSIPASRGPSKGTVYHIQDVHGHAPTQQKISQMIRLLLRDGTVSTVALEGGFGAIPLRELRARFSLTTRRAVADKMLARGRIAGPMHALSQGIRARLLWRDENTQLQRDKKNVFNGALRAFDSRVQRYHRGELSLATYAETVWTGDRQRFPHTYRFLAARRLTNAGQNRALRHIAGGVIGSFVNASAFMRELFEQENARYAELAVTPAEQLLVERSHALTLQSRLIDFRLTRAEWERYSRTNAEPMRPFESFYLEAAARDQAMGERLIRNLHGSAVVVTGGFHASHLDAEILQAGYAAVVLTPRVDEEIRGASAVGVDVDPVSPWEWTVRSADQTLAAPVWPETVEHEFINEALVIEPTARATFESLGQAASALMDDEAPLTKKMWALAYIQENPQSGDLQVLSGALLKYKTDEDLAPLIVEAIGFLRRSGVLKEKALAHDSIIGIIWKAVDEHYPSRVPFRLTASNGGNSFELSFHFPSGESFTFADQVVDSMNELYHRKNSHTQAAITIKDDTNLARQPALNRGRIVINLQVTHATLTDYQRGLGMLDFAKDNMGYYRAWTTNELVEKMEERARMYLDGLSVDSDEYNQLAKSVYGDGTHFEPGLLNVMRAPKEYGAQELIAVESLEERAPAAPGPKRTDFRVGLNSLLSLARYLSVFAHYIPEKDIQRWIFLARGAGSHFNAAFLKGLFRGHIASDYMLYVSWDTLGPVANTVRAKMAELSGIIAIVDPVTGEFQEGNALNFQHLELSVMQWLRSIYYKTLPITIDGKSGYVQFRFAKAWFDADGHLNERLPVFAGPTSDSPQIATLLRTSVRGKTDSRLCDFAEFIEGEMIENGAPKPIPAAVLERISLARPETDELLIYGIKSIYEKNLLNTPVLKNMVRFDKNGGSIVPKVCLVDEVANGTYDFIVKFALEELTRTDEQRVPPSNELVRFRSRDPFKFKDVTDVERWSLLEREHALRRATLTSVDVELFFGASRGYGSDLYPNPPLPGYPVLDAKQIMADFNMSKEEAAAAIEATTHNADFMPHPYLLALEEVKGLPILESVPIRLETRRVQLSAYLKDLLIYNGVVRYYQQNYVKLAAKPLLELLGDEETPASVKETILSVLPWFDFPKVLKGLVAQACLNPSLTRLSTKTALDMFAYMLSDAIVFGQSSAPVQLKNVDFVERYERLLNVMTRPENPFVGLMVLARACKSVCAQSWANFVFLGVPFQVYRDIPYFIVSELRRSGRVIVPLMSETDGGRAKEFYQRINEQRPLSVTSTPLQMLYEDLEKDSTVIRLLRELSLVASQQPLSDERLKPMIEQLIRAMSVEALHVQPVEFVPVRPAPVKQIESAA